MSKIIIRGINKYLDRKILETESILYEFQIHPNKIYRKAMTHKYRKMGYGLLFLFIVYFYIFVFGFKIFSTLLFIYLYK